MEEKGMLGLETISILIILIVIFLITLVFTSQSGIVSSTQSFFCPTLTRIGAYTRAVPLGIMWSLYASSKGIDTSGDWYPGKYASEIGFWAEEETTGYVEDAITGIQDSLPLFSCQGPSIDLKYAQDCSEKGISKQVFLSTVAKRTLDCWSMYTAGKYSPLLGMTPPNPRTCFAIQFDLNESVTFGEILNYLKTTNITSGETYFDRITGYFQKVSKMFEEQGIDLGFNINPDAVFRVENFDVADNQTYFNKPMKKGILFISYADAGADGWENSDCGNPSSDKFDAIFWCIDENSTYNDKCEAFTWT